MYKKEFLRSALGEGGSDGAGSSAGESNSGNQPSGDSGAPAPQGVVIPDNWKDALSEDFRNDKNMEHIKSVEDMAKSYINAQKHFGKDKIVVPGEYATEEDWNNIYNKLGRPETADGYEVALSEGSKLSEDALGSLKAKAHELGILPSQLKGLVSFQEEMAISSEKSIMESIENKQNEAINTLKTEWGAEYDKRLSAAANMVKEFGGEELQKYLNETGYGNDPMLVKTFYKIAQGMGEGRFEGDSEANGSGYTPDAAQRKILELQSHEAFGDKNHPMHEQIMKDRSALFPLAYPELNREK